MSILSHCLPESIAKEFTIDEKGRGYVSRRGIARLSGVTEGAIRKLLKLIESAHQNERKSPGTLAGQAIKGAYQNLPKNLQPFAGQAFDGGNLPDTLATAIIQHYAFSGKVVAQDTLMALGAVGLRVVIQSSLDWEAPRKLSDREIVELLCLPVPTKWQPRFSVEFYNELSRLTGLAPIGNKRPLLWAKITKELVYDYMPTGVYGEIKSWQLATDPNKKLHQYLSDSGIEILTEHLKRVITLMQGASSMNEVELMLSQSITKQYQQSLFAIK